MNSLNKFSVKQNHLYIYLDTFDIFFKLDFSNELSIFLMRQK